MSEWIVSTLGIGKGEQSEQSKRLQQRLEDANAEIVQLTRHHEAKISQVSQEHASAIARLEQQSRADIAELERKQAAALTVSIVTLASSPSAAAHLHCGSHSHRSSATVESTARIFPATEVFYGDYSFRTASTELLHSYMYVLY
eukprot:COSAG02_NODE_5331_length_4431_cov_4.370729_1_plen_144_part_00